MPHFCGTGGRGFKSLHPPQNETRSIERVFCYRVVITIMDAFGKLKTEVNHMVRLQRATLAAYRHTLRVLEEKAQGSDVTELS